MTVSEPRLCLIFGDDMVPVSMRAWRLILKCLINLLLPESMHVLMSVRRALLSEALSLVSPQLTYLLA